uniref:Uncharacterized protein n=1 Tax=Clytia hemisphaerica TaxID=252671 RepID=A0A7M5UT33_9CNID
MYIPICVGHLDNWAIRVGRGKHSSECLRCEHTCTFYASDQPLPGMEPVAVGTCGGPNAWNWKHSLLKGGNANGPGWMHDFVFYAYMQPTPGTIPIAIGHAADETAGGWKYRLSENSTYAGDKGWTHDFVFYVPTSNPDALIPIAVGYDDSDWTYKVKKGVICRQDHWKHLFTFRAPTEQGPDTFPVAVGSVGSGSSHRSRVSQGTNAGTSGWSHEFVFYMFTHQKPGTIPVAIGHADCSHGGWKYGLNRNKTDGGGKGWTHDFFGYVYPSDDVNPPVSVSVGYESRHWATLVRQGDYLQEYGFEHRFTLHGMQNWVPGSKPISIGEAGSPGNNQRSRIENGPNAG